MKRITALFQTVRWGKALLAATIGAVLYTVVRLLLGDKPFYYGEILLPNASPTVQTLAGAASVLISCLAYGLVFAIFYAPVPVWDRIMKAIFFSFVAAYLSIMIMPGASPVTFASSWEKYIEFLVFSLTMALLYTSGPLPTVPAAAGSAISNRA